MKIRLRPRLTPRLVAVACALALAFAAVGSRAEADSQRSILHAAQQGNADAQYKLGEMYDLGQGVKQDYREAVKWYRRAAEQGDARAQFALAEMYKNGDGVDKDIKIAVKWYRRAADQGNAGAQLLLGVLYESGLGLTQDARQAAIWYRRSADQGDARAQVLLGNLYQLGQGVPKSNVAAYALYSVAAANDASSGNPALSHRTDLAAKMNPTELETAKHLAEEMSKRGHFSAALDRYLRDAASR